MLAQSQTSASNPYPAIDSGNNSNPQSGSASPYPAAQIVSSGPTLDELVVTAAAINTVIGDMSGTIEQGAQLALLNARGWGVNQYLGAYGVRNVAHVVTKYGVGATVILDLIDPNVTAFQALRDAAVGAVDRKSTV